MHLAASLANLDSVEFHRLHQWPFDRLPADTFKVHEGGKVAPPQGAGLGIDLHYDDLI